jgi:peptide/nickel transport system permease protein
MSQYPKNVYIPIFLLILILILSFFVPLIRGGIISHYDLHFERALQPPSFLYPFGTDSLGRDLFSITFMAAKSSFFVGFGVVILAALIGVPIGMVAGFKGGFFDTVLIRITDGFLAFPPLILPFTITALLGPSLINIIIAIAVAWFPWYVRIVRAKTLEIRSSGYIEYSIVMKAGWAHILKIHIFPNIFPAVLIQASADIGYAILMAAGLSFLGLGAQPPELEWGLLITQSRISFLYSWWTILPPGIFLFITVVLCNFLGDSLREYYDPKL